MNDRFKIETNVGGSIYNSNTVISQTLDLASSAKQCHTCDIALARKKWS